MRNINKICTSNFPIKMLNKSLQWTNQSAVFDGIDQYIVCDDLDDLFRLARRPTTRLGEPVPFLGRMLAEGPRVRRMLGRFRPPCMMSPAQRA